ncbi:carotenoid oxygenase family protein [Sporosarcina sp. GW1-11]|uniref:carotenoid oxygenase family protein n=1 Tax=Sporosarcina sp. GW1-11 TaxID=2899126 RepID=UPI00294E0734|nr:carotenoid oxygenase family protein [Sporosarcina sp. GW1-11]MDV6377441.1 carotenoid oxygenase family protein [Sporosarcina sp. GW1-11]
MIKIHQKVNVTVSQDTDNPYLKGLFEPVDTEYIANTDSLKVVGEIPKDLNGMYVRNSHNQAHEPLGTYHPFDGDGMVHSIRFENGKAEYRNRFIETIGFLAEQAKGGKSLWPGMLEPHLETYRGWGAMGTMKDNAGVDVMGHNGKIIASMSQCGEPYQLDPYTLETVGTAKWGSKLMPTGICSHFKLDVDTGELMFFNFSENFPFMNYGVVDKNDQLVHYEPIELPGPRWPHDMGITKNYTILHDLPYHFDPEDLKVGVRKLKFFPNQPSRFGVVPRRGNNSQVKWFEASPCFILHLSNCYEDGDEVIMDGCIQDNPGKPAVGVQDGNPYDRIRKHLDKHHTRTHMYRWRFNMKTGETKEEVLDDEITEFPVVANQTVGKPYRYSYNVLFKAGDWHMMGIKKFDLFTGGQQRYEFGDNRFGSEPVIALRKDAKSEDDGYLLTFVTDMNTLSSECIILDAKDLAAGPVAIVSLPARITNGTHACWIEQERLDGETAHSKSIANVTH